MKGAEFIIAGLFALLWAIGFEALVIFFIILILGEIYSQTANAESEPNNTTKESSS